MLDLLPVLGFARFQACTALHARNDEFQNP